MDPSAVPCCSSNPQPHCAQRSSYTPIHGFLFPKESTACSTSLQEKWFSLFPAAFFGSPVYSKSILTQVECGLCTSFAALHHPLPPRPNFWKSSKVQPFPAQPEPSRAQGCCLLWSLRKDQAGGSCSPQTDTHVGRVFSRFSRSSKVTRFAKLQEKREQESQVHWTGLQGCKELLVSLPLAPPLASCAVHTRMEMGHRHNTDVDGSGGHCCSHRTMPCPHSGRGTRCHNRTVCPKRSNPSRVGSKPHGRGTAPHI